MSLVYAVRDSSPACPRSCVVEAMSWRAHLRWWALLQTLFHALATAPPYLATKVESNSLRSREVTLGTSRYQIPRSGLVQLRLCKSLHKRKNWLFFGDANAGERGAVLYSIIESCRRHGVEPYSYLRDVLTRLPSMTNRQIKDIVPKAWAAAQKAAATRKAA